MYHVSVICEDAGMSSSAYSVAQVLADPLRLAVLHRLMDGAATVGELVSVTDASQPRVSNHLRVLREHGLVAVRREGRQMIYSLAGPAVAALVEALGAVAGGRAYRDRRTDPVLMQARTCYDHLAGVLGVWLYDRLAALKAIEPASADRGDVVLGPAATRWFDILGVEPALAGRKRRFAFACQDWTERRPHLGGALGAALCDEALRHGWVTRIRGTRAVRLTAGGREALGALGSLPDRISAPARVGSTP